MTQQPQGVNNEMTDPNNLSTALYGLSGDQIEAVLDSFEARRQAQKSAASAPPPPEAALPAPREKKNPWLRPEDGDLRSMIEVARGPAEDLEATLSHDPSFLDRTLRAAGWEEQQADPRRRRLAARDQAIRDADELADDPAANAAAIQRGNEEWYRVRYWQMSRQEREAQAKERNIPDDFKPSSGAFGQEYHQR